jgi:hypothetical protein
MAMLTYFGRCRACRAELRVFDHSLGKSRVGAGLLAQAPVDDFDMAFEEPDGSFRCPRCDAAGRVAGGVVVCPHA